MRGKGVDENGYRAYGTSCYGCNTQGSIDYIEERKAEHGVVGVLVHLDK